MGLFGRNVVEEVITRVVAEARAAFDGLRDQVLELGALKRTADLITASVIKADVGSLGGHTEPSFAMLAVVRQVLEEAVKAGILVDFMVTHTGDDIALIMSHRLGTNSSIIHVELAWRVFLAATEVGKVQGVYGAGQDLLVTAPAGNVTGAGPAVAEIEFVLLPGHRRAESFMVLAADKCGPGAYNLPLGLVLGDPMHNGGLLLAPNLHKGWVVEIVDMDAKEDRAIKLNLPEEGWEVAALLRDIDRFAIRRVWSRAYPTEQMAAVSATRLHNIAKDAAGNPIYTGKDDPIALIRDQGIFPAPEELIEPYLIGHYVTGDARGSHTMPLLPVSINHPVAGPYCFPIVSCIGFSMDSEGRFAHLGGVDEENFTDFFGDDVWNAARIRIAEKGRDMRAQGYSGVAMASKTELAYTGIVQTLNALETKFTNDGVGAPEALPAGH